MQKLIRTIVKIFPKPIQKLYFDYEEKWLYLFFGVLTTAVSFITAGISKYFLEKGGCGDVTVGNVSTVISWICAVTFAYLTNRAWVFESHAKGAKEISREAASFYGGRLATLAVEWVMMTVGYGLIHVNYWVMKIIANIVVLILNYVISKIFVFRKKDETAEAADKNA
ncbi:MAG: GtrA family protein [Ruminococcus sp.]|nr:GtrA family protein [Ruminococcus sp.]